MLKLYYLLMKFINLLIIIKNICDLYKISTERTNG